MKIVVTTDSEILDSQLQVILNGISGLEISAKAKDVDGTVERLKIIKPEVLILSLNRLIPADINKIKLIKRRLEQLTLIILSSNPSLEYLNKLKHGGADYVFDHTGQLNEVVDVVCGLLYKRQLEFMLANNSANRHNVRV